VHPSSSKENIVKIAQLWRKQHRSFKPKKIGSRMARAGKAKKGNPTLKKDSKEFKVDTNADKTSSNQELKRNVIDLGGDSDDFELVQHVDSDQEVASHPGGKSDVCGQFLTYETPIELFYRKPS
jgi:hypothetical protein